MSKGIDIDMLLKDRDSQGNNMNNVVKMHSKAKILVNSEDESEINEESLNNGMLKRKNLYSFKKESMRKRQQVSEMDVSILKQFADLKTIEKGPKAKGHGKSKSTGKGPKKTPPEPGLV